MLNKLIRTLILLTLITTLILSLVSEGASTHLSEPEEYPEDYGCVHDNHSQYDDGDSINIDFLNTVAHEL